MVQTNHATLSMAQLYGFEGTPNIVLIGVPDQAALLRVAQECKEWQIPHYLWDEPDFGFGITALCTSAIQGDQRKAFSKYPLWKITHLSPSGKAAVSNSAHAGSSPAR